MQADELRAILSKPWIHGQATDLRGQQIEGALDLSGLAIGGFDLRGSHFADNVVARGSRFEGLSWFGGCTFSGQLDVASALFLNDARFEDCTFGGPFSASNVEFHGIARFDGAKFDRTAMLDHMTCYGNLSLDRAQFTKNADFTGSECLGGFWGNETNFGPACQFADTQVHGRLWLRGAQGGNTNLRADRFGLCFGYTYT